MIAFISLIISINKPILDYLFINAAITGLLIISNEYAFYTDIFFKESVIILS